jgi:MFS family permease
VTLFQTVKSEAPPASGLTREVLGLAGVVVLGSSMTILDATIVNVALPTLGQDLHTSIATIQWVPTIYLLAFASVIPLTGWLCGRFGAKTVWLASLGLFMAGSLLAGLSPSIGVLIGARVVQGLGGGMIMPLGQSMLAQAAGPKRMGRVMSIVGVPMLLLPVFGPLIGGALIGAASWRWIFLVNLPVGLLAIALAVRLLAADGPRSAHHGAHYRAQRLDVPVALFGWRALCVPNPLIDLRLFRQRGFAAGTAVNFVLGTALFGVALLLPLYFELVRGRTPVQTGLLLAPQGLGAAVTISLAGYLTDRVGARRVVPAGVLLALAGTAWYTQIRVHTPYWALLVALFGIGAGLGATITPAMAAAYQGLPATATGQATSAISVVQRVAGALGSALLAVVLQQATTARLPGFHGGIGQAGRLAAASPHAAAALAQAFGVSFAVALAVCVLALIPTAFLPRKGA